MIDAPSTFLAPSASDPLAGFPQHVVQEIFRFTARLRRRQVLSSQDMARKTLEIMRALIAALKKTPKSQDDIDVKTLIVLLKRAGSVLVTAQPHELTIGNMVRRVLAIVREEAASKVAVGMGAPAAEPGAGAVSRPGTDGISAAVGGGDEEEGDTDEDGSFNDGGFDDDGTLFKDGASAGPSLLKLLDAPEATDYSARPAKWLKAPILEGVNELIEELSSVSAHIAEQATEHIHANEVAPAHVVGPASRVAAAFISRASDPTGPHWPPPSHGRSS